MLAHQIVQTLFELSTFKASTTDLRACKETSWAVEFSVFTIVVDVLLSVLWLPTLGARGLLRVNSVGQSMQATVLFFVQRLLCRVELRTPSFYGLKFAV